MFVSLAGAILGMKRWSEMVVGADLLYETEWFLLERLNASLAQNGLPPVNFISDAFSKWTDEFAPRPQRDIFGRALTETLHDLGAEPSPQLAKQWWTLVGWMRKRAAFAHPTGESKSKSKQTLEETRSSILSSPAYVEVRDVLLVLIEAAALALAAESKGKLGHVPLRALAAL